MTEDSQGIPPRRGHGTEVSGGLPAGDRVLLPANAREPINVYVNGVKQLRGEDYEVKGRAVVFSEPIYKEGLRELSLVRKIGLGLGLFGWYERNEVVDVEYNDGSGTKLISDAPVATAQNA